MYSVGSRCLSERAGREKQQISDANQLHQVLAASVLSVNAKQDPHAGNSRVAVLIVEVSRYRRQFRALSVAYLSSKPMVAIVWQGVTSYIM